MLKETTGPKSIMKAPFSPEMGHRKEGPLSIGSSKRVYIMEPGKMGILSPMSMMSSAANGKMDMSPAKPYEELKHQFEVEQIRVRNEIRSILGSEHSRGDNIDVERQVKDLHSIKEAQESPRDPLLP